MDAQGALRVMIEQSGLTHRQISARLGKHDTYISQAVRRSPGADTLASIASACGYRLVLVSNDDEQIQIGEDETSASANQSDNVVQARALLAKACALLDAVGDHEI